MSLPALAPRIGVDLGGTKTEVIALSAQGETLMRKRTPTPSHAYPEIVRTVATLVTEALQITGPVHHIGIGVPGAPDGTGRMKNANTTCLIGMPLAADLQRAIGYPVLLENDANCFTLSEAVDGAGAGHRVVFGVILGTGVGGGWVVDRQLHQGIHHIAGEWGHNPIPVRYRKGPLDSNHAQQAWAEPFVDLGRPCYCGKTDCVETHLCGAGLSRTHSWLSRFAGDEQNLRGEEIVQAASAGDKRCIKTLETYARQLACALSTVINIVDPDVIVLGGGVSNIDAIYPHLHTALKDFVFNDSVQTRVVKALHGDSSGVRGAAWL